MGIFVKEKPKSAAHRLQSFASPAPQTPISPSIQPGGNQPAQTIALPAQPPLPAMPDMPTFNTALPPLQADTKQENNVAETVKVIKTKAKQIKQKIVNEEEIIEADMTKHKSAAEYQDVLDVEAEAKAYRAHRREVLRGRVLRLLQKFFIGLCVYMLFLICGVLVTQYEYDPLTGELRAQRMTIEELAEVGEFRRLQSFYIRARNLYEDVLTLDYKLANNPDRAVLIASEYEMLLDNVSRLAVEINAASLSPQYNQIIRLLQNWVQTDIAVYIQNVSTAFATNDEERMVNALLSREVVYNNFLLITENLEIFGQSIKGVQLGDIYEWSPERFLAELGGFVYE